MVSNYKINSRESVMNYDVSYSNLDIDDPLLSDQLIDWVNETTNDVYAIWNMFGELTYVSKSVERLLGYDRNDIRGILWHEIVDEEEKSNLKRKLHENTLERQVLNLNVRHQNEGYIWCEVIIKKVINPNDEIYFFTTIRDVSDKKEVEEMMIRSEKMSIAGQLAAGVVHEIRNPLTSIKGFLQLLQAGINHKDEYYKIMIDEIKKMETITSEMLFISKPLTDDRQNERVTEMVEDVITLLETQARTKGIEIVHKYISDSIIYCDRSQIKQVLINLVKNAIEAMNDSGEITITSQTHNNYVELNIIDEGEGIPEEIKHKLDEPFFTTKKDGTGLGLMITKQILAKHNATMDIIKNKDKGTKFRIRFYQT